MPPGRLFDGEIFAVLRSAVRIAYFQPSRPATPASTSWLVPPEFDELKKTRSAAQLLGGIEATGEFI